MNFSAKTLLRRTGSIVIMEPMKQKNIFLIIGIVYFLLNSCFAARAEVTDRALADATLTAYELGAAPADQPLGALPRWKSSLGEIQQAANTLLETNSKLNGEARQLKRDFDGLQVEIDQLRVKNVEAGDAIAQERSKAQENSDATQISRLKEVLAERARQVQAQKTEIVEIKTRHSSIENRVALMRLRVAGLEVDKQAKDVDVKFRDESAINALRTQVAATRDKILRSEQQVKLLDEKTAELDRVDNPYIAQTRQIAADNADLKTRLAAVHDKKVALQARLEQVAALKLSAEKDRNLLRVQKLLSDRNDLQSQLRDNSEQLEVLRNNAADVVPVIPGFSIADMDKLQKQNAAMEDLISDLRENVALLEYKVTTLQRYTDRNKAAPQK